MKIQDIQPEKHEIIRVSQFHHQLYINTLPKIIYSYFPDYNKYKRELLLSLLLDENLFNRAKERFPDFEETYEYIKKPSLFQELIQYYNYIVDKTDVKDKDKEIRKAAQKIIIYTIQDKKPLFCDIKISMLFDFCILQTDLQKVIPSFEATRNAKDQRKMPFMFNDLEYEKKNRMNMPEG